LEVKVVSATENPIEVCSLAAGGCYGKDNVSEKRIRSCVRSGHTSTIEFAHIDFKIEGVSRSLLAQLTRHRLMSFCVSGDTIVRTGRGTKKTVEELYNMAEQYQDMTILRCVDESNGMISYDHFSNVFYTGDKDVYEVETAFGYKVKTTADHQFLCEDGKWRRLAELQVGDRVMVNGEPLYQDRDWLKKKYWDEDLSQAEIATLCGVGTDCIRKWVRIFGLQKPIGSWSIGKEPPNKGKTKENYAPMQKTSEKMKGRQPKIIRGEERSDWKGKDAANSSKRCRVYRYNKRTGICENCGFRGVTEFHHINKNLDEYTTEYIKELCVSCHRAIHKQEIKERIIPNEIIAITYKGIEPVYDISMAGSNHNFIGNGFVLHNCVESQRYCKYELTADGDWYVMPEAIQNASDEVQREFRVGMATAATSYMTLLDMGMRAEDARYVLPEATKTNLTCGMNAREFLHFVQLRTSKRASKEIQDLAWAMVAAARGVSEEWNQFMDILMDNLNVID